MYTVDIYTYPLVCLYVKFQAQARLLLFYQSFMRASMYVRHIGCDAGTIIPACLLSRYISTSTIMPTLNA